ncbi:MAG: double-strand break repair protein AddB, partial [Pseudomonadota bacterium]
MVGAARLQELAKPDPALYSIPAGRPFLQDLATPLLQAYKDDPAGLADVTVFLPNRRAVRHLAEVIHDAAPGEGAVFLPRLRALGDVDEADLMFTGGMPEAARGLPPAADPQERRLILAHLIHRAQTMMRENAPRWAACLDAADALGRLLDECHTDDISLDKLQALVPPDVVEGAAGHWQQSLEFLSVVTTHWPQILSERGAMEPAARRRKLMQALAEGVLVGAATRPMIVAGSLGTVRATGQLMAAVARAPMGMVVLPGFDTGLDDAAWAQMDPPHPQGVFWERLERDFAGVEREAIRPWPLHAGPGGEDGSNDTDSPTAARRAFLSLALRPANATNDWYTRFSKFEETGALSKACEGLSRVVADTPDEEASLISLLIREALEEDDKSVMVVTPDRDLARRVAMKLEAWDLQLDDSGGVPLAGTVRGTFLRSIARWFDAPSDPVRLMEMLKHELTAFGQDRNAFGDLVRALDCGLRGPTPVYRFEDILGWWENVKLPAWADRLRAGTATLLSSLVDALNVFVQAPDLIARIGQHVALAETLAATDKEEGQARLWRFEDGEPLAVLLEGLLQSEFLPPANCEEEYADLFYALLSGGMVRKRGGHPRVAIYGLLEARLQTADLVILAGLNEGVWPDAASMDPFLSRPMRKEMGLASPEQMIGQAAHDFSQGAAMPNVVLTRSIRQGRAPATPSRWMVRLESFLSKGGMMTSTDAAPRLRALNGLRQTPPSVMPASAPFPKPAVETRPCQFSITDIERLLRDPYGIYAKRVLGLRPWRRLGEPLGPADRGELVHLMAEQFAKTYRQKLPAYIDERIADIRAAVVHDYALPLDVQIFWQADLNRAATFLSHFEEVARTAGQPVLLEGEGAWTFTVGGQDITLRGRADRMDMLFDRTVRIIDFKTGEKRPTNKQASSFSPQLLITALMVEGG